MSSLFKLSTQHQWTAGGGAVGFKIHFADGETNPAITALLSFQGVRRADLQDQVDMATFSPLAGEAERLVGKAYERKALDAARQALATAEADLRALHGTIADTEARGKGADLLRAPDAGERLAKLDGEVTALRRREQGLEDAVKEQKLAVDRAQKALRAAVERQLTDAIARQYAGLERQRAAKVAELEKLAAGLVQEIAVLELGMVVASGGREQLQARAWAEANKALAGAGAAQPAGVS